MRGQVFGQGLAVLGGWYVTCLAGVAMWVYSRPDTVDPDCTGFGCWSPRAEALFGAYLVGMWVLPISGVLGLVALAVASSRVESGLAAGNLAAAVTLCSGVVIAVAIVAFWTIR